MGATRSREVRTNVNISGIDKLLKELSSIENPEPFCEEALEAAGKILVKYMGDQIDAIKTTEQNYRTDRRYAQAKDKKLLQEYLGYTPIWTFGSGTMNIKIGFANAYGYATKSHPAGVPVQLLANSINRGTSFMIPQPFITRTVRKGRQDAIDEMQKAFDAAIKRYMKKAA